MQSQLFVRESNGGGGGNAMMAAASSVPRKTKVGPAQAKNAVREKIRRRRRIRRTTRALARSVFAVGLSIHGPAAAAAAVADSSTDGPPPCRPIGLSFKAVAAELRCHAAADSRNLGAAVLFAPKESVGEGSDSQSVALPLDPFRVRLLASSARARGPS